MIRFKEILQLNEGRINKYKGGITWGEIKRGIESKEWGKVSKDVIVYSSRDTYVGEYPLHSMTSDIANIMKEYLESSKKTIEKKLNIKDDENGMIDVSIEGSNISESQYVYLRYEDIDAGFSDEEIKIRISGHTSYSADFYIFIDEDYRKRPDLLYYVEPYVDPNTGEEEGWEYIWIFADDVVKVIEQTGKEAIKEFIKRVKS